MLICLLLCAAAVSSTVLSDQVKAQNAHLPEGKVHELVRRDAPPSYLAPSRFPFLLGRNDDFIPVQMMRDFERRGRDSIGEDSSSPLIRNVRNGRDFDTLLGRSFGVNKRRMSRTSFDADPTQLSNGKRNFDEIDNAGFSDYLRKRQPLQVDPSWGALYTAGKRNFDEIDNAGFKDYLYKRDPSEVNTSWDVNRYGKRNFDEIDNAGFKDYLYKRQPPQMDFPWDVMSRPGKRNFDEIDNAGFKDYLYKRVLKESRGIQEVH